MTSRTSYSGIVNNLAKFHVVARTFSRDGAWRKTMEPQNPGSSPGPGPEVREKQKVAKEQATQRVRSWIVQNETSCPGSDDRMRCINDSRFYRFLRDKNLTEGYIRCHKDEKGNSERNQETQFPQRKLRGRVCRRV